MPSLGFLKTFPMLKVIPHDSSGMFLNFGQKPGTRSYTMKLFEYKKVKYKIFFKVTTLQADMKINLGGNTVLINNLKVFNKKYSILSANNWITSIVLSYKYQTRFKSHQSLRGAILEFLFLVNDMKVCVKLVCFYSIFMHGLSWKWLIM